MTTHQTFLRCSLVLLLLLVIQPLFVMGFIVARPSLTHQIKPRSSKTASSFHITNTKDYDDDNNVGRPLVLPTSSSLTELLATNKYIYDGEEMKQTKDSIPKTKKNRNALPKITTIQNLNQFLEFLSESEDKIVVVEFYAAWCKSCHKFGLKYKQLARKYGDQVNTQGDTIAEGKVRFAQVEYGANVRLCRTFGIKKLPYIQIYKAPIGKLSEFVCGPNFFEERLTRRLEEYLDLTDEEIQFKVDMEEGQALGDDVILDKVREMANMEQNTTSIE